MRVKLDAPSDFLRILVDGRPVATLRAPGAVDRTFGGLSAATHVVRLEKLTESQSGGTRFDGFFVPAGEALPAPAAATRQIQFVGDSYTVGYGNLSPTTTCTTQQVHDRTDSQQAFGPLLARRLGADYRVIAYSGFGMVRNYNGSSPDSSLPALYPRVVPGDAVPLEPAGGAWHPQVIVVNLGTNDFSKPVHAGERWADEAALHAAYRARYVGFVTMLRQRQPQARVVLMASDLFAADVAAVAARLDATSARPVVTVRFTGLAYSGCHGHPSTADDKQVADLLERTIATMPAVWPDRRGASPTS